MVSSGFISLDVLTRSPVPRVMPSLRARLPQAGSA
jgi:hypothetical protein